MLITLVVVVHLGQDGQGVRDKWNPEAHWPASLTYTVNSRAL